MSTILFWNAVALEANRVAHSNGANESVGPVLSARALAIAHLAMHDAYFALAPVPGVSLYLPAPPTPPIGANVDAAVAGAAYGALVALFPSQEKQLRASLSVAPMAGSGLVEGLAFGQSVAQAMLADRSGDPGIEDDHYVAPLGPLAHQVDPDNSSQGYYGPFFGARSRCFATPVRHHLSAPPTGGKDYDAAVREVRGKGISPLLMGTVPPGHPQRTVEETIVGLFWAYDGANEIGTPPRLYNQIVRRVAEAKGNDDAANARLFALVNVAMADAGILAWDDKYHYNLWRPVVGIRNHDPSMGDLAVAGNGVSPDLDIGWLPLGAPKSNTTGTKNITPNFPAYPSGHATFGAAALHVTRLFFGTKPGDRGPDKHFDGLSFVSDELNGTTTDNMGVVRPRHSRAFPDGLWQMIVENGRSRVYLGVHWIFDAFAVDANGMPDLQLNVGGVRLGLDIAESIFAGGRFSGLRRPSAA